MRQSFLLILRDPEVDAEGTEAPLRSFFDHSLAPNPTSGLSLMFLLYVSLPPWTPLLCSYLDPEYTTASGSPV